MSYEAYDLIDRPQAAVIALTTSSFPSQYDHIFLTEDPDKDLELEELPSYYHAQMSRLIHFSEILTGICLLQKAAFVHSSEGATDTSYFTTRYSWNPSDKHVYTASEYEDSSDNGSLSGSSSCLSNRHEEVGDECGILAEFDSSSDINYSFSNFSFKGNDENHI